MAVPPEGYVALYLSMFKARIRPLHPFSRSFFRRSFQIKSVAKGCGLYYSVGWARINPIIPFASRNWHSSDPIANDLIPTSFQIP
ncbi:hypothetical protein CUMW_205480, partial [Citrus unshiu]